MSGDLTVEGWRRPDLIGARAPSGTLHAVQGIELADGFANEIESLCGARRFPPFALVGLEAVDPADPLACKRCARAVR